jgi:hypothetical protein
MKILFIGKDIGDKTTGGDYTTLSHLDALRSIYGKDNIELLLIPSLSNYQKMLNVLLGRGYGFSRTVRHLLKQMSTKQFDFVYCVSSVYGMYSSYFNKKGFYVFTFFQNVEYSFYKQKLKIQNNLFEYIWFLYIRRQEQKAIDYSDKVIVLNKRDADIMFDIYERKPDGILPIFFKNKDVIFKKDQKGEYLLFVGSDFYANNEGLNWFINNVARNIPYPIWIVGTCCDYLRRIDLILNPNIKLLGYVNNLSEVYANAACVIAPIFSGSGMKTKTIEAFAYGKSVIGTPEAFVGIDGDRDRIGGECVTRVDFIDKINAYMMHSNQCYNDYTFSIFEKKYSFEVNKLLLKSILEHNKAVHE